MYEKVLIRTPDNTNRLFYVTEDALYTKDMSNNTEIMLTKIYYPRFDACISKSGIIYAVCSGSDQIKLIVIDGAATDIHKLDLPANADNFRLLIKDEVLSLHFTAITGGRNGLYHYFIQSSTKPQLLGICALSKRPYCAAFDYDGDFHTVFVTPNGRVISMPYKWSKKDFAAPTELAHHSVAATSPYILITENGAHYTYIAREEGYTALMYHAPNAGISETVFKGCSADSAPILYKHGDNINIMWYQNGICLTADTKRKAVEDAEERRSISAPNIVGVRLPVSVDGFICYDMYAHTTGNNIMPLAAKELFATDLKPYYKPKQKRQGEDVEGFAGYMPPPPPQDLELERLKVRIKLLEDALKTASKQMAGRIMAVEKNIENKKEEEKEPKPIIRQKPQPRKTKASTKKKTPDFNTPIPVQFNKSKLNQDESRHISHICADEPAPLPTAEQPPEKPKRGRRKKTQEQ